MRTNKYFFEDREIEEAMIKSCLLFKSKEIKGSRDNLFQKYLLSLIIGGKGHDKTSIKKYLEVQHPNLSIDDSKIDNVLNELKKKGMINFSVSDISLKKQIKEEADYEINKIVDELDELINDILQDVKDGYKKTISNEEQIKQNIKECINYYYRVSGISFFELDIKKDISDLNKLEDLASYKLYSNEKELLSECIIYAIGRLIDTPTEKQKNVLERLAQVYITTQIMNIDPLLNNFKSTIISQKVFILDTDIILYAITENASLSKQYRMMIKHLLQCGCKLYLPQDVITEVYDHAEAAKSSYPFYSNLMTNNVEWAKSTLKNVFLEDFYMTKQKNLSHNINWNRYLGNFYNPSYGLSYTFAQIKERLGDRICYNDLPNSSPINEDEKNKLGELVLEETIKTEKANHRDEDKNKRIAETDTMLYLTVKKLNLDEDTRNAIQTNNTNLLQNKHYLLTNSVRVHYCAKALHLDSNVLCNPLALIAYLSETSPANNGIQTFSLFDNPFLLHTARIVWDDAKTLINYGVDIKGKNIVALRYDLQSDIQNLLAIRTQEDYDASYTEISEKGYEFDPYVKNAYEKLQAKNNENEELKRQLQEMQKHLEKTQKEKAKANYLGRVKKNRSSKRK